MPAVVKGVAADSSVTICAFQPRSGVRMQTRAQARGWNSVEVPAP